MKIKLKYTYGKTTEGSIVEAVVAPDKLNAVFYDEDNVYWTVHASSFEIVEDEEDAPSYSRHYTETTTPQQTVISLRELLGQDIKSLEFK